jgi:hypothetical protein
VLFFFDTMSAFPKYNLVMGLIIAAIFGSVSLENCSQHQHPPEKVSGRIQFAGSESCAGCHKEIYQEHLQSFHHLTSALATKETLKGDFDSANKFFINDHLAIVAEKRQDSFYQTAYSYGAPKLTRPFNITVGSGKRGQTSIYWFQNYLFELPLTWFTETDEWTISPGYSRKADFNRSITSRCLECHSTFFQETTNKDSKADEFSKTNFILGVECERCHGSGVEHIAFHQTHPAEAVGHAIFNPAKATRTQSLDLCRLCHGRGLSKSQPSFTFHAGDSLFRFFQQDAARPVLGMDVHGNQFGMLAESKCYLSSQMTCLSCHDGHKNQSREAVQFYVKCEACHKSESHNTCKLAATIDQPWLRANCINCHMPEEASRAIMVIRQTESVPTSAHMRSHYITIYRDISNQLLSTRKK